MFTHKFEDCDPANGKSAGQCSEHKRRTRHIDCSFCQANPSGMLPPHDASRNCESGRRIHCTCDRCF